MLKALAWKEWREQRPVVLVAFLLMLLLPLLVALGKSMTSGRVDFGALAFDCTLLYGALLWPLTALLAGSGTISGDAQGGTLPFLFTRPVRRTTVWTVKVATALAVVLMVAVVSGLFARLMVALTGGGAGSFLAGSDVSFPLLSVALFMLFASAVFFSTVIDKPLLGAAAALALSSGVLALVVTLQGRFKILLGQEAGWLLVEVVLLAVLLLVVSLFLFARGEMVGGSGRRLGHILMGLAVLLASGLVALPLVRAFPSLAPGEARIAAAVPSPDGRQLLMAVNGPVSHVRRIWSLTGHDFARLTGIMGGPPAFTPDGQWVMYPGVEPLSGRMSLRKMRPDGSGDILLTKLSRFAPFGVSELKVSPDGRLVAAADMIQLAVIKLDQPAEPAWYGRDLGLQDYIRIVGWTPDSRELLFLGKQRGADAADTPVLLRALDVDSGVRRTIGEVAPRADLSPGWDPRSGVGRVPLTIATSAWDRDKLTHKPYRYALILMDAMSGHRETITEDSCWWGNVSMTADERWLAYAICEPEGEGALIREVHLRDLETGEDRILATMDHWLGGVLLSPDGTTVLAASCEAGPANESPRTCTTSILTPGGPDLAFPEGWSPLAWGADHQVYLGDDLNTPRRVALGSVTSGKLDVIFP